MMNQMQTLRTQMDASNKESKQEIENVKKGNEAINEAIIKNNESMNLKNDALNEKMDKMSKMLEQLIQNASNQEDKKE